LIDLTLVFDLLESITESTFWEDMIEETYRSSKVDEVSVEEDMNVNSKENELADLKDDYWCSSRQ
jgi:hypothetical protein